MKHVWAAEYCPCGHESEFGIIALAVRRVDAEAAMKKHRAETRQKRGRHSFEFWRVRRVPVTDITGRKL